MPRWKRPRSGSGIRVHRFGGHVDGFHGPRSGLGSRVHWYRRETYIPAHKCAVRIVLLHRVHSPVLQWTRFRCTTEGTTVRSASRKFSRLEPAYHFILKIWQMDCIDWLRISSVLQCKNNSQCQICCDVIGMLRMWNTVHRDPCSTSVSKAIPSLFSLSI